MYEFVGAIAGRTMMVQGQVNRLSLVTGCLGHLGMSLVATYTKEPLVNYLFVLFKHILAWLLLSSLLGIAKALALGWTFPRDPNPRTRAWQDGPSLPGWMRALRDLGSALLSVFVPLDPRMVVVIERGLGWGRLGLSLGSLLLVLTLVETIHDYYPIVAPPGSGGKTKKSS